MASHDIAALLPQLQQTAWDIQPDCLEAGFKLLIYCTYRSPHEQARLFRQSRRLRDIAKKASDLTEAGFPNLSEILLAVGPQPGLLDYHVTNAAPGESWHQYRNAFDAVPLLAGKPHWEISSPLWLQYGKILLFHGLNWGGSWHSLKDYPHAQLSPYSSPLSALPKSTILNLSTTEETS